MSVEEKKVYFYQNGHMRAGKRPIVREFPLSLKVNGRDMATLIASPHDLRYLVAGFLRMQGFVRHRDDFLMLSVCEDFGFANVQIRGEVPEKLLPVLTSGCGTGVTFNLQPNDFPAGLGTQFPPFAASTVFELMEALILRAQHYRSHGGIHSAAVGDAGGVTLYAEDIGRHNTLDRIAGEALLKDLDITGRAMVTSGRISSEMVAKAVQLGIILIASRTSPTDEAVRLSEEYGITLIGYLRHNKFCLYAGRIA